MDEIKVWRVENARSKVAYVLMTDGVAFSFTPEEGFVFTAPDFYVERLILRLKTCYGVFHPVINEI